MSGASRDLHDQKEIRKPEGLDMDLDQLFLRFAAGLFLIVMMFGLGMTVVILWGDSAIGLRMVSTFGSMFTGVLGLGSGYILGRSRNENRSEEERRPHDRT